MSRWSEYCGSEELTCTMASSLQNQRIILRENIMGRITEWRLNTQESLTRQRLIELGWTPPEEQKDVLPVR